VLREGIDFSHMWGEVLVCVFCPAQGQVLRDGAMRSASYKQAPWLNPISLEILFSQISHETIFHLAVVMDNVLLGISQC